MMSEAIWLGVEAQQVIAMRLVKITSGGAAAQTEIAA
jgi:hypothetical protein